MAKVEMKMEMNFSVLVLTTPTAPLVWRETTGETRGIQAEKNPWYIRYWTGEKKKWDANFLIECAAVDAAEEEEERDENW